jgi:Transcription factor WhiB
VGTNGDKVIGGLDQASRSASAAWLAAGASWRSAAACRSADPELFFPLSETLKMLEQIAEATAICAACPVRRQCLEFALRTRQTSAPVLRTPSTVSGHRIRQS